MEQAMKNAGINLEKKEIENIFKNINPEPDDEGNLMIKYTEFIAVTLNLRDYLT